MKILIIGQCSLQWGRMEFGNIGNYYILEPFVRELHNVFPNAHIKTTMQLSERFCKDEKIRVVPLDLYYGFTGNDLRIARKEIDLVDDYIKNGVFIEKTSYIEEVLDADLVIDFSGDIWGDNANFLGKDRFEVGLLKDMVAQKLGKPTFLLAGSPGPFNDGRTEIIAKEVFKDFTLITNREPISTELLKQNGFDVTRVKDLACPAFLFEPAKGAKINKLLDKEGLLDKEKPSIGFIICGWNFKVGPFDKWPREDSEYDIFAEAIEFVSNNLGAKVYLMSHSNGFPIPPVKFELQRGRDFPIINQLHNILKHRGKANEVILLDGIYDVWATKAIIGNFDMLVSGRVHGAVAGLSQSVPTVILDYGHEPKAHKLRGFARVADQEGFLCDPNIPNDIIDKIKLCWNSRELIRERLDARIPFVQDLAKQNFRLVKENFFQNNGLVSLKK